MTDIRTSILNALVTAVGGTALIGAGGGAQKVDSRAPTSGGNTHTVLPYAIIETLGEVKVDSLTDPDTEAGLFNVNLDFRIDVFAKHDDADTRGDDEILFDLITEIEKAIAADRKLGLPTSVVDTRMQGFDVQQLDRNDRLCATYRLQVHYQHEGDDPAMGHG